MSSLRVDERVKKLAIALAEQDGWSPMSPVQVGEGNFVPQYACFLSKAIDLLKQTDALAKITPKPMSEEIAFNTFLQKKDFI